MSRRRASTKQKTKRVATNEHQKQIRSRNYQGYILLIIVTILAQCILARILAFSIISIINYYNHRPTPDYLYSNLSRSPLLSYSYTSFTIYKQQLALLSPKQQQKRKELRNSFIVIWKILRSKKFGTLRYA